MLKVLSVDPSGTGTTGICLIWGKTKIFFEKKSKIWQEHYEYLLDLILQEKPNLVLIETAFYENKRNKDIMDLEKLVGALECLKYHTKSQFVMRQNKLTKDWGEKLRQESQTIPNLFYQDKKWIYYDEEAEERTQQTQVSSLQVEQKSLQKQQTTLPQRQRSQSVSSVVNNLVQQEQQVGYWQKQCRELTTQLNTLQNNYQRLEEELARQQCELPPLPDLSDDLQNQMNHLQTQNSQLERESKKLASSLDKIQVEKSHLISQLAQQKSLIEELSAELANSKLRLTEQIHALSIPNTPLLTTQFINDQATQTNNRTLATAGSQTDWLEQKDQECQTENIDKSLATPPNQSSGWAGLGYLIGSVVLLLMGCWLKKK